MGAYPFSRAVYVFRAKRADRVKLIFWDGTGLCLFARRLEDVLPARSHSGQVWCDPLAAHNRADSVDDGKPNFPSVIEAVRMLQTRMHTAS
jgi:hypothetical protein